MQQEQHKQAAGTNGAGAKDRADDGLSAIERLCIALEARTAAGVPVARVEVVRPLSEKAIDSGILFGTLLAAGTAVVAIARFGFGIGKVHAPLGAPTT